MFAPALPGFGGTPGLPRQDFHLAGYAAWLEEFIRAVGVQEKVVVVGHSFGGGVGIRLAYDHPDVVRSLVLVNSIGGSSWKRGKVLTSIAERPLWDWGLHFPSDVWPIRQATRVLPVILEDALPNLVRSPSSVVKVANMARRADLRPELEELKRRRFPVTVIWASRDGIIPQGVLRGDVHRGRDGRHRGRGQPLVAAGRPRPVRRGHHQRPRRSPSGPREMEARSKPAEEGSGALRRLFGRPRASRRGELDRLDGSGPGDGGQTGGAGRRGPAMRRSPRRRVMPRASSSLARGRACLRVMPSGVASSRR